jgi:hypothetical protein
MPVKRRTEKAGIFGLTLNHFGQDEIKRFRAMLAAKND